MCSILALVLLLLAHSASAQCGESVTSFTLSGGAISQIVIAADTGVTVKSQRGASAGGDPVIEVSMLAQESASKVRRV